jgi:hypothetical protein
VQEDDAYHAGTGAAVNASHAVALTGPLAQPWAGALSVTLLECRTADCCQQLGADLLC